MRRYNELFKLSARNLLASRYVEHFLYCVSYYIYEVFHNWSTDYVEKYHIRELAKRPIIEYNGMINTLDKKCSMIGTFE